jgi:hypothetical protein
VDGKLIIDGEPPPRGTRVTVFADDDMDDFRLDAEMQSEQTAAAAEIARGAD